MTLNKDDKEYRDNSKTRIRTRLFVAVLTGIFANWTWLFIIIGFYTLGELFTMYKVLTHSFLTDEKLESTPEERGNAMGSSIVASLAAGVSTLAVSCIVKFIRDFIISLF
jgi:uncharacterized membrane protein